MTRTATFEVTLSRATTRRTAISYRTVGITAEAQYDYTEAEGLLIFEPGEEAKTIAVQVRDNVPGAAAKRFVVTLFSPDGLEIARADGIFDIPAG